MRTIRKGPEPEELRQFRTAPGATYPPPLAVMRRIREALVNEQRGLCCYCMSSIDPVAADAVSRSAPNPHPMQVEHWAPRSSGHDPLDYSNMLGVCTGGKIPGGPNAPADRPKTRTRDLYCEAHRGDHALTVDPSDPTHRVEERIDYDADGRIFSRLGEHDLDRDLDATLNLNVGILRRIRRGVVAAVEQWLSEASRAPTDIDDEIRRWAGETGTGLLEEMCMVAVVHLQRLRGGR